jgi:hypothetical protein
VCGLAPLSPSHAGTRHQRAQTPQSMTEDQLHTNQPPISSGRQSFHPICQIHAATEMNETAPGRSSPRRSLNPSISKSLIEPQISLPYPTSSSPAFQRQHTTAAPRYSPFKLVQTCLGRQSYVSRNSAYPTGLGSIMHYRSHLEFRRT